MIEPLVVKIPRSIATGTPGNRTSTQKRIDAALEMFLPRSRASWPSAVVLAEVRQAMVDGQAEDYFRAIANEEINRLDASRGSRSAGYAENSKNKAKPNPIAQYQLVKRKPKRKKLPELERCGSLDSRRSRAVGQTLKSGSHRNVQKT